MPSGTFIFLIGRIRNEKLWLGIVATMLMVVFVAPASAWEYSMTGTWLWGYDYMAQGGDNDFFGQHNIAPNLNAGAHWRALNTWVGARTIDGVQYGVVTGHDASLNWSRVEFQPEIKINNAVRLRGAYQIGGPSGADLNNIDAAYGLYPNSYSYGAWNNMASGAWSQFWMTAQTPWGILIAGKRPFAFGMGAQYDGSQASSESLGVVAPYGPFRIGLVAYPWRGQTWVNSGNGPMIISTVTAPLANNGAQPGVINYRLWDNEAKRQIQPGVFFTYDNGPLSLGAVYEWFLYSQQSDGRNDCS